MPLLNAPIQKAEEKQAGTRANNIGNVTNQCELGPIAESIKYVTLSKLGGKIIQLLPIPPKETQSSLQ